MPIIGPGITVGGGVTIANTDLVTSGLLVFLDAANLISYSGTGTTWYDLSGNTNNATLTNGPVFSLANMGYFTFDGINDYAPCSGSNTVTSATFSVWIRRNGNQVNYTGIFFSRGGVGGNTTGLNFFSTSNTLGYHWNDDSFTYNFNSNLSPPDGAWCMTSVTVTSTVATFYLHQASGITTATNTTSHASSTLAGLNVAYDPAASLNRFYKGDMSICMLYNRALTSSELLQNFNATRGRYGV